MNNEKNHSEKKNLLIFEDTLSQCLSNPDILESILYTIDHFQAYRGPINYVKSFLNDTLQNVLLVNCSSLEAVALLECMSSSKIAVLDFASATTPGGGTLVGSRGQEEDLCRLTSLYLVLNSDKLKSEYYIPNKATEDIKEGALDYDVTALYLPQIKVLKDAYGRIPAQNRSSIDVIVCAAPNLRNRIILDEMQLEELVYKRACCILESAIHNQCKNIVLGAHGCGAFRNPVSIVGKAYAKAVANYKKYFDTILFAIPEKDKAVEFGNLLFDRNKQLENLLTDITAWRTSFLAFTETLPVFVPNSEFQEFQDRIETIRQQVCTASLASPEIREALTATLNRASCELMDTWSEATSLRRAELSLFDE